MSSCDRFILICPLHVMNIFVSQAWSVSDKRKSSHWAIGSYMCSRFHWWFWGNWGNSFEGFSELQRLQVRGTQVEGQSWYKIHENKNVNRIFKILLCKLHPWLWVPQTKFHSSPLYVGADQKLVSSRYTLHPSPHIQEKALWSLIDSCFLLQRLNTASILS